MSRSFATNVKKTVYQPNFRMVDKPNGSSNSPEIKDWFTLKTLGATAGLISIAAITKKFFNDS